MIRKFRDPHSFRGRNRNALDVLIEGTLIELLKYNGIHRVWTSHVRRIGSRFYEPGLRGDSSSGSTKPARLETGLEVRVPLFNKNG